MNSMTSWLLWDETGKHFLHLPSIAAIFLTSSQLFVSLRFCAKTCVVHFLVAWEACSVIDHSISAPQYAWEIMRMWQCPQGPKDFVQNAWSLERCQPLALSCYAARLYNLTNHHRSFECGVPQRAALFIAGLCPQFSCSKQGLLGTLGKIGSVSRCSTWKLLPQSYSSVGMNCRQSALQADQTYRTQRCAHDHAAIYCLAVSNVLPVWLDAIC